MRTIYTKIAELAALKMNVNLEDVIDKILSSTKKTKKEILARIEAKKDDLGGLITDEGAACIVAKELGVEIFETTTYKRKRIQLKDLIVGMNAVSVLGRVAAIFGVHEYTQKSGQPGTRAKFIIQDPTSQITVILWNEQTSAIANNQLTENDIIEIKNAYIKGGLSNQLELHLGKQGVIEKNPGDVDLSEYEQMGPLPKMKINQLRPSLVANIVGKIQWKSNITTFPKNDGTGQVASLTIFDESGQIRVALWNDNATFVDEVEINDIVEIINGSTRTGRDDDVEIHIGDDSLIRSMTDPTLKLPDAPTERSTGSSVTVKIKDLISQQKNLKVIGKIIEKLEPREVTFKDGSTHNVCDVTFADETGNISLSIWDDDIDKIQLHKIYCIDNGYISVFRGNPKLNVGKFGSIEHCDEEIKKVNLKNNLSDIILDRERKHISDLQENERVDIFGTIVSIPEKNPVYKSCPTCSKKVTEKDDVWECPNCGKIPEPLPRMLWSFTIDDGTETIRVTVGGEVAEELLGMTASEAEEISQQELIEQYPLIMKSKDLLGKRIIVKGSIRYSKFSEGLEMRANAIELPNPREELTKILERVENYI